MAQDAPCQGALCLEVALLSQELLDLVMGLHDQEVGLYLLMGQAAHGQGL